jgi:anti-sigma B factor antagonist
MKFTIDKHERYVVITPHEEVLDGVTAPKIKSEFVLLNTDGQRNIILDLSKVKDADTSGLRCALTAHRLCHAAGGVFVICCASKKIMQLIELSNLKDVLHVVPSSDEAEDLIFMEELEKEFRGQVATDEE